MRSMQMYSSRSSMQFDGTLNVLCTLRSPADLHSLGAIQLQKDQVSDLLPLRQPMRTYASPLLEPAWSNVSGSFSKVGQ